MITRQEIRTKIYDLLQNSEYKNMAYDEDNNITDDASDNGSIDTTAIDALLDGYFNNELYAEAKSATIIIVECAEGIYYNEIPTAADLAIAIEAGFDTSVLTSTSITYDGATMGAPTGDGIQPLSYSVESKGDFFGDLNTFALIAAAAYELSNDRVAAVEADLANLRATLSALGLQI